MVDEGDGRTAPALFGRRGCAYPVADPDVPVYTVYGLATTEGYCVCAAVIALFTRLDNDCPSEPVATAARPLWDAEDGRDLVADPLVL